MLGQRAINRNIVPTAVHRTEGEHRPVLLDEVMAVLDPKPGEIAVDCTLGGAGHAEELLRRIGPDGCKLCRASRSWARLVLKPRAYKRDLIGSLT